VTAAEFVELLAMLPRWQFGDGVPPHVCRFARAAGVSVHRLCWCQVCGVVAFAIDAYEREQLDALGFHGGICPDCRGPRSRAHGPLSLIAVRTARGEG
jgi:hypothetical protein